MMNPLDNRVTYQTPLTFEVNYFVTGRAKLPNAKGHGKQVVIQECTDIINIGMLGLEEESKESILEFMYLLKGMFEQRIAEGLGIESESKEKYEADTDAGADSGEGI